MEIYYGSLCNTIWDVCLCYMRMEELVQAEFRHHHVISTSLNINFFEQMVPLIEQNKMVKWMNNIKKCLEKTTFSIKSRVRK